MAIPSKRPDCNADTVLPAIATAIAPSYTEGDAVPLSTDLAGKLRTDSTGSSGGGTEFNEDAAHVSGAAGTLLLADQAA